jgi:hypothetical protein
MFGQLPALPASCFLIPIQALATTPQPCACGEPAGKSLLGQNVHKMSAPACMLVLLLFHKMSAAGFMQMELQARPVGLVTTAMSTCQNGDAMRMHAQNGSGRTPMRSKGPSENFTVRSFCLSTVTDKLHRGMACMRNPLRHAAIP